MIYLDQTIEDPDGADISFAFAYLKDKGYAGPKSSCSWDYSGNGEMTYWCYWADTRRFIETMLGRNVVGLDKNDNKRYIRTIPHRFPTSQYDNLYASKILEVKGIPGEETVDGVLVTYPKASEGGVVDFYYAEITVGYEPSPWPMLSELEVEYNKEWKRFTTIQKTPRLDYNVFAVGTFQFIVNDPTEKPGTVPHGLPLREESIDYLVTFHRCPEAFFNAATFIGKANMADGFLAGHPLVPTNGFAANTMQLVGMGEIIKAVPFTSYLLYDFQYFFQHRPNGFNKIRRNQDNLSFNYQEFSLDGEVPIDNTTRAVPLDDLTQLFQPNA